MAGDKNADDGDRNPEEVNFNNNYTLKLPSVPRIVILVSTSGRAIVLVLMLAMQGTMHVAMPVFTPAQAGF